MANPWIATVAKYKRSSLCKSCWQLANTVPPFLAVWYAMYLSLAWSYWLLLLLAVPAAGFRMRIFIIQHDCGHHSFFRSRLANDLVGFVCGIITLTPYHFWKRTHARHHVTSGNLDQRGFGDVGTLTVDEYLARSRWGKVRYRLYRHPLFTFGLGASLLFVVRQRFTGGVSRSWRRERLSVHATNVGLLTVLAVASWTIGTRSFLLIEAPIVVLAAAMGTWLFYIQHQYERAYWRPDGTWDFTRSALEGSSYYRLPSVLQWFTGNIGFHHIHHLNSRIPNYHLAACYAAEPAFRQAVTLGLWQSLECSSLKLWDERLQRMVGFPEARRQKQGLSGTTQRAASGLPIESRAVGRFDSASAVNR